MYFAHLNERLNQTITQQLQYLEENQQEGWVFNPEVAQIEITTTFYASYENAYIPHSPESLSRLSRHLGDSSGITHSILINGTPQPITHKAAIKDKEKLVIT